VDVDDWVLAKFLGVPLRSCVQPYDAWPERQNGAFIRLIRDFRSPSIIIALLHHRSEEHYFQYKASNGDEISPTLPLWRRYRTLLLTIALQLSAASLTAVSTLT
jgi:hypothetical protein